MTGSIEYLDLDDLIELTVLLLGEPAPIRDIGLLGSAAARPQTTAFGEDAYTCLLYTSPSPRDRTRSRMPSSA